MEVMSDSGVIEGGTAKKGENKKERIRRRCTT